MNIDPKILEAIMSGQNVPGYFSNRTQGYWQNGYGPEAGGTYIQPDDPSSWTVSQPMGSNMVAEWLGDGTFRGINQDTSKDFSNGATLVKAAIMAAAGAAGADALGASAAAGETGGLSGMDLAADAAVGTGNNIYTAGAALGGAPVAAGSTGLNSMRSGELANYSTNGSLPSSAATSTGGGSMFNGLLDGLSNFGGSDWLKLAASLYSAADANKDRSQTTTTAPWGPAQPALVDLIGQIQKLNQKQQQQPVSQLLQQSYGNQSGLLNAANQGAAGMLAGMQANAGGQNSYSRQNKGRSLVGSNPVWNWTPGLLNMGG